MRVLISGAQGFTGRYLVARWLAHDADTLVFGFGRSPPDTTAFTHRITLGAGSVNAPLPDSLAAASRSSRYRYFAVDLLNHAGLVAMIRDAAPDIVIHLASGLRDDPTEHLFRTNVLGTEALYTAIHQATAGAARVVLGSSGSVYGIVADDHLPVAETRAVAPFDMYSISKCAQESVARMLAARFGIPTLIARIFAIVGPGQDERHICGRLAAQIATIEAGLREPAMHLGPLTATRDFIDVRDTAEGLLQIALRGHPGTTYNLGSGRETPIQQVYDDVLSLSRLSLRPTLTQAPARPIDMPRNVADMSRLAALGVTPHFALRQSLADLLDYYRMHLDRGTAAA